MMFRELHTIAQAATLHMIIVAEGEQLRVTLQPKPTGKDAPIPAALSLVATPDEFDTGFVEAITTWRAPQTSLVAQAAAAAAQAPAMPAEPKTRTASKPAAKAPAKPVAKPAKKKAAASPTPPNADAQAPAAATPGAGPSPVTTPEASAPVVKVRTARTKPDDAETIEKDRLACIADMRAYLAGNAASDKPVKPSRADYLNKYKPTTGRRYERLFANFDELVAAAQQQALPAVGEAAPNAEAQQPGETNQVSGSDVTGVAPDTAVAASAPVMHNPQPAWPMVATTDDGTPATVALKDLQPPAADATAKLFEGEPVLDGHKAATPTGFSLDII